MYCRATNNWIWVSGDSVDDPSGIWGVQGVSSPSNKPDGRWGSVGWKDAAGNLYFFGGVRTTPNFGRYNDLWKYSIDYTCVPCSTTPIALFNSDNHICPGACITFNNLSITATSFVWSFPGATPDNSTDINPSGICYPASGTYDVTLIASNANGSDTLTLSNYITVYPQPSPQGIFQSGDTLFANAGASSYQWYYNGSIINGATNYFYVAQSSGDYNVVATDSNGCEVEAVINDVIAAVGSSSMQSIQIYPNPVISTIEVRGLENNLADEIKIFNVFGEKVYSATNCLLSTVNCLLFPAGLYYIEITSGTKIYMAKFVKQ